VLVGVDGCRITDSARRRSAADVDQEWPAQGSSVHGSRAIEDTAITRATDVYAAGCVLGNTTAPLRGSSDAVACAVLPVPIGGFRLVPTSPRLSCACMRSDARRPFPTASFSPGIEGAADGRHRWPAPEVGLSRWSKDDVSGGVDVHR
jgi:hypothetical protein